VSGVEHPLHTPTRARENRVTKDFFISYTATDRSWAEWVAWVLEEAEHICVLQAWDFRPGANFAVLMNEALVEADRTIAVLSAAYLESRFATDEWTAAFVENKERPGRLIPVRVEPCRVPPLLAPITFIDLADITDEATAQHALRMGVRRGRVKPDDKPPFPPAGAGPIGAASDLRPVFPRAASAAAQRLLPQAATTSRAVVFSEAEATMQAVTWQLEQLKLLDQQRLLDDDVRRGAQQEIVARLIQLVPAAEAT
jgi:hypothetical protein